MFCYQHQTLEKILNGKLSELVNEIIHCTFFWGLLLVKVKQKYSKKVKQK